MTIFQALLLSAVEGITEFLPISSTGHLILVSDRLSIVQTEFVKSFEVIIQLGAILAVVVLYWKTLMQNLRLWKPILTAFLPTAVIGLALYQIIKHYLIGNVPVTVTALLVGGVGLIVLEKQHQGKTNKGLIQQLNVRQAVVIGLAQSLSIIPGVSRSAASIIGAMFVGLSRGEAVLFSFLLAIPTMFAATALDLIKTSFRFSSHEWILLTIGFVGAFFTAMIAVKAFVTFIQRHNLIPFGVYRIILALLFLLFSNPP